VSLIRQVPSLQTVDNVPLAKAAPAGPYDALAMRSKPRPDAHASALVMGSDGGLDVMEKEYLAALKGEKDTSVIA
jgi:hypothetical protein